MASATATKRAETKAPGPKHNIEAMRQEYYERIAKHDMTPLWKVMSSVVTKEPVTRCAPVIWHFDDIKRLVMESGGLITAEEAERRVLVLENPALRGQSRATNTLFAGVQLILPGEVAPRAPPRLLGDPLRARRRGRLHRGRGREGLSCRPATSSSPPNWAPHDHGNTSKKPMLWLDVLDLPQVNFFEASFAEHFDEATQNDQPRRTATRSPSTARACCRTARRRAHEPQPGHQLHLRAHAADHRAHDEGRRHRQAPRRARALRQSGQRRPGAADHGRPPRAVPEGLQGRELPLDRRHHLRLRRRPAARPRSTARCWNGARTTCSWCRRGSTTRTTPTKESVLFSISDRPSQEALGIWREDTRTH